ncbi:MAG: hypothetical protein EDM79_02345 [Chloroflexi bacterium]|nr:MAG: hypothetical protein EDM79_02345 [Chloroflexota bacterium]
MKIDLGKILTRSWQIIWNHKVLWIFGIFAGFANSNGFLRVLPTATGVATTEVRQAAAIPSPSRAMWSALAGKPLSSSSNTC